MFGKAKGASKGSFSKFFGFFSILCGRFLQSLSPTTLSLIRSLIG